MECRKNKALAERQEREVAARVARAQKAARKAKAEQFIARWSGQERVRRAERKVKARADLVCSWCKASVSMAGRSERMAAELHKRAAAGQPVFCGRRCAGAQYSHDRDRRLYGPRRDAAKAFESADTHNLPEGATAWRLSNAISWIAAQAGVEPERKLELSKIAAQVLPKAA
jgi:hypothetical protein